MNIIIEIKVLENDFLQNKMKWENWRLFNYLERTLAWIEDAKYGDINYTLVYNCFLYGKNKTLFKPVDKIDTFHEFLKLSNDLVETLQKSSTHLYWTKEFASEYEQTESSWENLTINNFLRSIREGIENKTLEIKTDKEKEQLIRILTAGKYYE